MAQMKKEIIENGIHYTFHGDYYFPALEFAETPQQGIGRYGRMRKSYLEKHRPGLYERLILSGKLYEHLAEIGDQLAWVRCMNSIRQRTEEIILNELVYA